MSRLLRQLCDQKASESTGIIMLLTLSTVICSQQKWKNNQIDLSMSHVPCTTIPVDRIPEVVFWQDAHIIDSQEELTWVVLKHGLFFHCPRDEKISLKPLNERSSKFRRTRYFSEFDDVVVKTFYFMFRPSQPLIEVGTGDFKGKIWFAFTEY